MDGVPQELRAYLSRIGRKGGQRSRRVLASDEARRMVRVREARKLYTKYHARCFWNAPRNWKPGADDIEWIVEGLRKNGGREGWEAASRLCR